MVEPSAADQFLTQRLKQALQLIDVRVLDHFVVGSGNPFSFAERGLLDAPSAATPPSASVKRKHESGLEFDDYGSMQVFRGTEAELVSAKIIQPEWIPGWGDNNKTMQRVVTSSDGIRLIKGKGVEYKARNGETVFAIYWRSKSKLRVERRGAPLSL